MKKIPTFFKKDPNDLGRVINEINDGCEWVITEGIATRKFDGTAAAVIDTVLYKRYDVKKGRSVPDGAIPCQEPDPITGHWPHWVKVEQGNPADKHFIEALIDCAPLEDGTYELIGPKVQGNPEKFDTHFLIKHGEQKFTIYDHSFQGLQSFLSRHDIEGIVWHHPDGRMCKLRKSDFGIKR